MTKHASEEILPGFETRGRHHQKSKTGISVAPRKGLVSSNFFQKKELPFFINGCICELFLQDEGFFGVGEEHQSAALNVIAVLFGTDGKKESPFKHLLRIKDEDQDEETSQQQQQQQDEVGDFTVQFEMDMDSSEKCDDDNSGATGTGSGTGIRKLQ